MFSEQSYFGFLNEFEVYTGNFSKFIKNNKQKKLNKEQNQKRILNRIVQLRKFSNKAKFRASLWYLVSYLYSYPIR